MERVLRVVDSETGEVVERIDVSGKSDRMVERVMSGMLINMHDGFHIEDSADDPEPDLRTVDGAWARYGEYVTKKHTDAPTGSKLALVCACGLALADLMGFPDGADVDGRAEGICNLFGQEAFGRDIEWAYGRALRRVDGEHADPSTASGVVVTR